MRRIVLAIAAAVIVVGAASCSTSGTNHGAPGYPGAPCKTAAAMHGVQPGHLNAQRQCVIGATGSWAIASCEVDVTYIDTTNTVDYYVPDTEANFRQHYVDNTVSGAASLAVVITFVNNTGGTASLPTGLVVSFTDQRGNSVGTLLTFNNRNGSGYGRAVVDGHGAGEAFSSRTVFSRGQAVAESPDIGASLPPRPDLSCHVSKQ